MSNQDITLAVEGMTCGACVRHVEDALRALDGVTSVDVKLREGQAVVTHDPARTPVVRLLAALDDAGYTARAPAA